MPTSLVLPSEAEHDEESMLARLPDQLFGRVFSFLETLDIFRMTLVCKKWNRLIDDNVAELKRAEHSITTHLIRFTEWMDPASELVKLPLILFRIPVSRDSRTQNFLVSISNA